MISGALEKCGFHIGIEEDRVFAAEDDSRGYRKYRDVVAINDTLLSAAEATWFQPTLVARQQVAEIGQLVEALNHHSPWLLKDPRLLFTWPSWATALKTSAKLFVYRSPLAVARSLSERYRFPLEYGLDLWEVYNRQAIKLLHAEGGALIDFDALSDNHAGTWEQLQNRLQAIGVAVDLSAVAAAFNQQTGHGRAVQTAECQLSAEQQQLHHVFLQACESGQLPQQLPAKPSNPEKRVQVSGQAFSVLSQVEENELLAKLEQRNVALEAARIKVRMDLVALRKKLEQKDADLLAAGQEIAASLKSEQDAAGELALCEQKLAKSLENERQLEAKAEYLFGTLDTVYVKLLAYRKTPAGKLGAALLQVYKVLTLRPRLKTNFDRVIDDAHEHIATYKTPSLLAGRSRFSLLFAVLFQAARNPIFTIRSTGWSRIKRAISVFIGTNRDDLEIWIQTRFPAVGGSAVPEVKPELESGLDRLELAFAESEQPRVSIVIPVFNEYRMTIFCLQSLLDTTTGVEFEVILADDASSDLTMTIGERVKGIKIVRADTNQGFVNNCRNGASRARGEYLLFLNNDTAFTDGWLSNLVAVLDKDPMAGIVGPMLLFGNGRLQEAGGIIWQDGSGWNYGRMDDPESPQYTYLKETDYISGACLLIRRKLWKKVGGFDQRFVPAYYEDTDLCFAVRAAGFKVLYQPASRVYHFEGISNGTDLSSGVKKHQVANKEKFLVKWQDTLLRENFPNAERVFLARDRSFRRRTVLVIDHYVPMYDQDAGSRSTWQYLKLMVEMGYNVKFLGENFFPHQPYTENLQAMGVEVLVGEKMARNYERWLQENARYIDVIYLHRPHIAKLFSSALNEMIPKPKLIYFGHDLHFLREQRQYELTGDRKHRDSAEDWKRRELAVFHDFDKVYYPSQVEVDLVAEIAPQVDVSCIPLYMLDESELEPYCWKDRADILFVGGFNHSPNLDAIFWFVEEILPLVVAACPNIRLNVVGSKAPDSIRALASKHVVIHGYLSDEELLEQYRRTKVVAVPLRYGAGVKGKVLEALQHGVPLVTTSIGAEGLPEASVVLNIRETAADFAQELIEIERGFSQRLRKLDRYPEYLKQYFSKSRAREILCRDFGEPIVDRKWLNDSDLTQ